MEALEQLVSEMEVQLRTSQDLKQRLGQKRTHLETDLGRLSEKEINLSHQKQFADTKIAELELLRCELQGKLSEVITTLEGHRSRLFDIDEKVLDCANRSQQAETAASNLSTECEQTSVRLSQLEDDEFKAREAFHEKKSRLGSLLELQQNLEGYSPTAREILLQLEGTVSAIPLAEVFQPEAGLEDHFEMLLGADMNTLLVQTADEAETLARIIEERGLERVKIAAISEMGQSQNAWETSPEGTISALHKVRIKEGYDVVARRWLGNVSLCVDQQQVLTLRRQYPGKTFLTASSRVVAHADGSLRPG